MAKQGAGDAALSAVAARLHLETRFIGDVMGSYVLASRPRGSGPAAFACRARSISVHGAVVSAPVKGEVGEALSVNFEDVGLLRGRIARLLPDGFAMSFECKESERTTLGSRIAWLKRRALKAVSERRVHKRVLPRETRARLTVEDGGRVDCMLIDMSRGGAAVSADLMPAIGTPVIVGAVEGQVVRHLDCGFAVRFTEPRELETLEALLTLKAGEGGDLAKDAADFEASEGG